MYRRPEHVGHARGDEEHAQVRIAPGADDRTADGSRNRPGRDGHDHQPGHLVGVLRNGLGGHGVERGEDARHGEAQHSHGGVDGGLVAHEQQRRAQRQRPGHVPGQVFHVGDLHQHPRADQCTDDAAGVEARGGEDRRGIVDQPHRQEADAHVGGDKARHAQRREQHGTVFQQAEAVGESRGAFSLRRFRHRSQLQPETPDHRKARIDRQQEPPRTRRGDQPRDDRSQQQERSVAEYLTHGEVAGHPLAGNDGRQQGVDGHLDRRVADAQQTEAREIPPQSAVRAGGIGRHQPRDGEAVAQKRRGLAAPAVHQRRDRSREHQKPEENHRRQEAHGGLLSGREFGGDAARDRGHHVAETHDEEARKHGSEQSFVYFVYAHPRRNFGFQIFQSYIFFRKKRVSGGDYFTIAPLRHAADTIQ